MSDLTDELFEAGTFRDDEPDTTEEETTEEVVEPEESGADEQTDDAPADPVELIDGKFKSQDDLLAAYHEAQRALHESRQPRQEEEEDEGDDDPYGLWGTALGDGEANQLAERLIQNPHEAQGIVEWVEENKHQFGIAGEQIADSMFQLWHNLNPRAAIRWDSQQQWAQREAERADRIAPLEESHRSQVAGFTVARAKSEIPRYTEFENQAYAEISGPHLQQFLADNPEYKTDPDKQFALLEGLVAKYVWNEFKQNQQLAASASNSGQEPGITEKAKPRTQQRSTAAAPSLDEVEDLFPSGTFRQG